MNDAGILNVLSGDKSVKVDIGLDAQSIFLLSLALIFAIALGTALGSGISKHFQ